VSLTFADDFEAFTRFTPRVEHDAAVAAMLDEVIAWGRALRAVRRSAQAQAA
jgi:hypothetical protein